VKREGIGPGKYRKRKHKNGSGRTLKNNHSHVALLKVQFGSTILAKKFSKVVGILNQMNRREREMRKNDSDFFPPMQNSLWKNLLKDSEFPRSMPMKEAVACKPSHWFAGCSVRQSMQPLKKDKP
jgi:hypothetical protein